MTFTAHVDPAVCEGHGQCLLEAPGVFDADADGYSHVALDPISGDLGDLVTRAVRSCPAGAISMSQQAGDS